MCERGINRKYVNYTTVRTGRAHHAGKTTLSASFQTLCARISFQTSEILETGCLKRVFFVVSCARLCRNRTVPALRSGCACSLPSVGIAHLTSLNSPCLTGHIASTTNDKLYLSSASVLFLLADANSSYTIFFGTPIFFGVRPGACLSDSSPHHTQCTQTFIPHARIHLSAHAPRQPDISCFLVMLHRSPPSRRLPSRPPHRPPRHPSSVQ